MELENKKKLLNVVQSLIVDIAIDEDPYKYMIETRDFINHLLENDPDFAGDHVKKD